MFPATSIYLRAKCSALCMICKPPLCWINVELKCGCGGGVSLSIGKVTRQGLTFTEGGAALVLVDCTLSMFRLHFSLSGFKMVYAITQSPLDLLAGSLSDKMTRISVKLNFLPSIYCKICKIFAGCYFILKPTFLYFEVNQPSKYFGVDQNFRNICIM